MSETKTFLKLMRPFPDCITEARILGGPVYHGLYDDPDQLVQDVTSRPGQHYATLNPVDPKCHSRAHNRLVQGKRATKDSDILRRTALLIDIDPVRPSGIPSTDAEHEAALQRAREIKDDLHSLGWPEPMMTDSGNGAGLIFRIDLPPDDGGLVKRVLQVLARRFDDEKVKIDTSVHNPSRITRLIGTMNCKGENTPERPHRMSRLVEAPDCLEVVTLEQLEALAGSGVPTPATSDFEAGEWLKGFGFKCTTNEGSLGEHQGIWHKFPYCPFRGPEHADGNSAIFQSNDRRIVVFKCHHAKCQNHDWKALRLLLDQQFDERAEAIAVGCVIEGVRDPHRLARIAQKEFQHRDGPTIMLVGGNIYTWNGQVWVPRTDQEIRRHVCRSIKKEFDRYARARELRGAPVTAPQVTTKLVGDVFGALASTIEAQAEFGAWIEGDGPSIEQLIVCNNGIVDLVAFAEGREDYLIPHTPKLFVLNRRDFEFSATAPEPKRWMEFLNEVWPNDPDSQTLLQDFMGYCLTDDVRHQKFLLMFGQSRGGKGTITRLLTALIGEETTCAIRLGHITQRFALEAAIGKSLLLIPDATTPKPDKAAEIVELLKGIVGGDMMNVDRKQIRAVSLVLPVKIVVTSNNMLDLPDDSAALYERMLVLRFQNTFKDNPDLDLDGTLLAERAGILLWCIEGWKRLRERGRFVESGSGCETKAALRESASPVKAFVAECCVVDPRARAAKDELYAAWSSWCRARGTEPSSRESFGKSLLSAEPTIKSTKPRLDGGRLPSYQGIALKDEADQLAPVGVLTAD